MVTCNPLYTPRDMRNLRIFNIWFFSAMLVFCLATILMGEKIIVPGPIGWALAAITIGLMVMMVRAYVIFVRAADELLRKIHVEALAIAFGAAIIFMIGWRMCERLGAPKLDVDDPVIVMVVVFSIVQWVGTQRYAVEEGQ